MKNLSFFLILFIVCSGALALDLKAEFQEIYLSDLELNPVKTGASILATSYLITQDEKIMDRLQVYNTPQVQAPMSKITHLGEPMGIGATVALFACLDEDLAYQALQSVVFASVSTGILKASLGLARPAAGVGREARFCSLDDNYHSLPSGHTAVAFALAGSLAQHQPQLSALGYGVATLVGLSRLSLGRHWPSDVLAGAIIGIYSANRVGARSPLLQLSF